MKTLSLVAIAVAVACMAGCASGTPPAASGPPANVAGSWTGTIAFTTSAGQASQAVTMTLAQSGTSISGTWQAPGGTIPKNGTVGGTTTASSFAGTFTITISNLTTGTSCSGTLAVSGPAGGNTMTWTSPGVVGTCSDAPNNVTFTLVRQS